jgi:hypothetical protein
VEYSSADAAKAGEPVSIVGLRVHVLLKGARYDLESRRATVAEAGLEEE